MKRILLSVLSLLVAVPAVLIGLEFVREPGRNLASVPVTDPAEQIARGAYLVRAGDCMACHTERGGQPYAGGRAIPTPFGNIFAPNITPEATNGIGAWSSDDFWRALHNGRSKDGSFLYPAFPYPNYTKVTRADSDAMHAYLMSLAPVNKQNKPHELRFPYNQRILLAGWRAMYFRPAVYQQEPARDSEWNRGAYLVQGLGHCSACHTARNMLGASDLNAELGGGTIPGLNWYASSLRSDVATGLGEWEIRHIADLLKTGVSPRGAVFGPMAEVVRESLQYLSESDAKAMATYLKSLPPTVALPPPQALQVSAQETERVLKLGAKLYEQHCAACHQANGEGVPPAYPPLAGNRSLSAHSPVNAIRIVLNGGYPPSTGGNPRPFGMPPFAPLLSDTDVAAVVSYLRNAWGNGAEAVSAAEVGRYRGVPVD